MKTQNNNQGTAKSQVSKMVLYSSAVIFSVASISLTASAQNFWKQFSNTVTNVKTASVEVDQNSGPGITDAVDETNHAKVSTQMTDESNFTTLPEIFKVEEPVEYNPEDFVNAEMEQEKENLFIGNNEALESESGLQIEALTSESEYNATKFVADEIRLENENWMNKKNFI